MKVLVSGSSGLIGSALVPALRQAGHQVVRLVRRRPEPPDEFFWLPDAGQLDRSALEGVDAVVHLAGETIGKRWTSSAKERIRASRIEGARLLTEAMREMGTPPRVFVSASAVGYYGDRGSEILDENEAPGRGFLAEVCKDWEAATRPAVERGVRVVNARTGIVLSGRGGALKAMLPLFQLGLGGVLGDGRQYMSWIAIDDVVRGYLHLLEDSGLSGPVNLTSPNPVTNAEFTQTLAKVLGRPAFLRVPAQVLTLPLGEMAQETLLASQRAIPRRLLERGFQFQYPELEGALRHVLGR
ncbi:Epimerase family protein [bacterium HR25]|nr:Epimerase family protein [bacterium HR25]